MKSAGGDATQIWKTNTVKQKILEAYGDDVNAKELFYIIQIYHL